MYKYIYTYTSKYIHTGKPEPSNRLARLPRTAHHPQRNQRARTPEPRAAVHGLPHPQHVRERPTKEILKRDLQNRTMDMKRHLRTWRETHKHENPPNIAHGLQIHSMPFGDLPNENETRCPKETFVHEKRFAKMKRDPRIWKETCGLRIWKETYDPCASSPATINCLNIACTLLSLSLAFSLTHSLPDYFVLSREPRNNASSGALLRIAHLQKLLDVPCNTLPLTATHDNTLQLTAAQCSTLQHATTHCNTLQHAATYCSTLQHTATHGNTRQHIPRRPPLYRKCREIDTRRRSSARCNQGIQVRNAGFLANIMLDIISCVLEIGSWTLDIGSCTIDIWYQRNSREESYPPSQISRKACRRTLQRHCKTLQHIARHCKKLQDTVRHCDTF